MGAVSFSLDQRLVTSLKEVLALNVFCETGSFKGDTINTLHPFFDRLVTIELSEPLWKEVSSRFSEITKVQAYLGNSSQILSEIIPTLKNESVLYWLDAHWCVADDTSGEQSQCPLLDEIHAIGSLNDTSAIIIDDARLFLAPPAEPHEVSQWPTIDAIVTALRHISPLHELMVVNDVIVFYPKAACHAVTGFARKHGVDWLRASQSLEENATLRVMLEEKDTELRNIYTSHQETQAQLHEKDDEINALFSSNQLAQLQLHEKDNLIIDLHGKANELNRLLQAKEKELSAIVSKVIELQKQSEEKEAVIQELAAALRTSVCLRGVREYWNWCKDRVLSIFSVRLGVLFQHPPFPMALPGNYRNPGVPQKPALKISIVTPAFRHAAFIERTMKSILDQQYPNLEYFVQDGASEDGTKEILQKYTAQLAGWESVPDGGQSQAINLGLKKTSGEIMAWLNSDDLLLPGSLAYVSDYFARHPEVDVVYGHRILIDENDQQIGRWMLPKHDGAVLSWADYVPQETLFWRRTIWEKAGGQIDESFRFAMDWDLIVRFRNAGARFACLPRFIGGFRIHPQQKTSAVISDIGIKEMNRIRERELGKLPTSEEIDAAVRPFLRNHLTTDLIWRIRRLCSLHY